MSLSPTSLTVTLADEADTIRLGEDLALALRIGDCLALTGDLGAGKSTLARAFLRAMADDADLEVPSPTFTLVQAYDLRIPVAHFDFYRLADPSELDELGFEEALNTGICLVEWPEMAESELPQNRIRLVLEHEGDGRRATIMASAPQRQRIERVFAIRDFLRRQGLGTAKRRYLTGDASVRAYEYLPLDDDKRLILMDWPRQPEGPAVLDGKPYPKVAHIAENAYPFVALAHALRERGFAAPDILATDYDQGILLLEDLGTDCVLDDDGRPIAERYVESARFLAALHEKPVLRDIAVTADHTHHIPDFDRTAIKMEARLLIDWHLPWKRGTPATEAERESYGAIWDDLVDRLERAEKNLLLRDFHSPNIIWRPFEHGVRRIGLIDFQDAMIGPTAYDVASLVQDARVTISPELRRQLMETYLAARRAQGGFDEDGFLAAWSIMAAQRNCKLAGLWVRLMQRDGKAGYMKHMPRTLVYLATALEHPDLAPLRDWCAAVGIGGPES
ncbi:tRNA (adenosine(37)-N6)-threonylcarbamoyltransferase complex ATPase subunit type 1 TsaE [Rhizobium sp. LjRoot30]|uniref:tRNA (adenosine(37)-N6)-threonylcarbamoyltransferase complex ATPase subunit type 1 TsaE n=1 Tax=Rhizobium sp. LjRoot30 TaxID=3342320 RepID=UPI003ECE024F